MSQLPEPQRTPAVDQQQACSAELIADCRAILDDARAKAKKEAATELLNAAEWFRFHAHAEHMSLGDLLISIGEHINTQDGRQNDQGQPPL